MKSNGKYTVEDANNEEDIEAGPALPPNEAEENVDDEEGRFFGGGITNDTADVLNLIDERDKGEDAVWIHRQLLTSRSFRLTGFKEGREDGCSLGAEACSQFRAEDLQEQRVES